jgi:hypothetical protein
MKTLIFRTKWVVFCVITPFLVFSQKEEKDIRLERNIPVYFSVQANSYADSVVKIVKKYLLDKKYQLLDETKYQSLTQEYFSSFIKDKVSSGEGINTGTIQRKFESGNAYAQTFRITCDLQADSNNIIKAKSFLWNVIVFPPNPKISNVPRVVDVELLVKNGFFDVLNLLLDALTLK